MVGNISWSCCSILQKLHVTGTLKRHTKLHSITVLVLYNICCTCIFYALVAIDLSQLKFSFFISQIQNFQIHTKNALLLIFFIFFILNLIYLYINIPILKIIHFSPCHNFSQNISCYKHNQKYNFFFTVLYWGLYIMEMTYFI